MAASIGHFLLAAALVLGADPALAASPTKVSDPEALARLKTNHGLSVQWIDWNRRGRLDVTEADGQVMLAGAQQEKGGPGRLRLNGAVTRIDKNSFRFRGAIEIDAAPPDRPHCRREGEFDFRITGKRRYWRLQQMEACAGLTDYVDIYF